MIRRRLIVQPPPPSLAELARFDEARQRIEPFASEKVDSFLVKLRANLSQTLADRSEIRHRISSLENDTSHCSLERLEQVLAQLEAIEYVIDQTLIDLDTFVAQTAAQSLMAGGVPTVLERQLHKLKRDDRALIQASDSNG